MTRRKDIKKREREIKELILERCPVKKIAGKLGLHENTIRNTLTDLVNRGELIRIPNTNPALYSDPRPRVTEEIVVEDGYVDRDVPYLDCLPPRGRLPLGYVNRHISGFIGMKIRCIGDFEPVALDRIRSAYWTSPESGGNGQTLRQCEMQLFGQKVKVSFYNSTNGVTQFRVYPGRIYVNPKKVSVQQCKDYMIERALYIASLLRRNGWQVTDPQIRGTFHTGRENDPLAQFIPSRDHDTNNDITCDTSHGILETEMEDPSDEELVQIYSNIPSTLKDMRQGITANASSITAMKDELLGLREVVGLQTSILTSIAGNVTSLSESMVKFTTMEATVLKNRITEFTGQGYQ